MGFLLGLISNRPDALQRNLPSYAAGLKGRKGCSIVVCDDESSFGANSGFLGSLSSANGLEVRHLSNLSGKRAADIIGGALGRDVSRLFANNFGGLRNLVLLSSHALGSNIVFVDDDTSPLYDFVDRYEQRFSEGYKLVPGGYEGHVDLTSPALLYLICKSLNESKAGAISAEEAASGVRMALRGVPPKKASFTKNMFVGGNVGVSQELAAAYAFLPTAFRIEDAVYMMTVGNFLQQDKMAIFRAYNDREALALTPLAEHTREPSAKPSLFSQLVNELKGSVAAKLIDSLGFESLRKETVLSDGELELIITEAMDATWSDFNMKNNRENLSSLPASLDAEDRAELERVASLEKKSASLTLDEAKGVLDDFSFCLKAWPYVIGTLEDAKVRKEVLDALSANP